LRKIAISFIICFVLYRVLLFVTNKFWAEHLSRYGLLAKISPYVIYPFLIGILIVILIRSQKLSGWILGALFIALNYIIYFIQAAVSGFFFHESVQMLTVMFFYLGVFSLLFASLGGVLGDLIIKKAQQSRGKT